MKTIKLFVLLLVGLVTINVTAQLTDYHTKKKPNYSKMYKSSFAQQKDYAINKTSFAYNKGDFWRWVDKQPDIIKGLPVILTFTTVMLVSDYALSIDNKKMYKNARLAGVIAMPLTVAYTIPVFFRKNKRKSNKYKLQSSYKIYRY